MVEKLALISFSYERMNISGKFSPSRYYRRASVYTRVTQVESVIFSADYFEEFNEVPYIMNNQKFKFYSLYY